jgi:RsiW-degrading membrane proteinase PrsW (M82 family)
VETEHKTVISVHKPDLKEKLFFFFAGLLVSVPFTVVFSQLSDLLYLAIPALFAQIGSVAISTPFIEEFAKVFPLFYRHGETERSVVSLGILAGLGFGLTEFALNVLTLGAPFIAILPWMFFHASSAGITAYGIAKKRVIPFYLISVGLHAASGLFALIGNLLWYVIGPTILIMTFVLAWNFYRRTTETIVA